MNNAETAGLMHTGSSQHYPYDEKTLGEHRVRTKFNPSESGAVDEIKQTTARLINLVDSLKDLDPRLAALAQTTYEEAAMWAVKLATAPRT